MRVRTPSACQSRRLNCCQRQHVVYVVGEACGLLALRVEVRAAQEIEGNSQLCFRYIARVWRSHCFLSGFFAPYTVFSYEGAEI